MKSFAQFARRFATALVLGSLAPTAALALEPAPVAKAVAPAQSALVLVDAQLATSIEARNPIGAAEAFDTSVGAVYGWVKIKNLGEATTITMVWKKEGKKRLAVELPVGRSTAWQTWSKKGIGPKEAGSWSLEVLDADGILVGAREFNVKGGTDVGVK